MSDSGTDVRHALTKVEVIETDPTHGGQGIFECTVDKMSIGKNEA